MYFPTVRRTFVYPSRCIVFMCILLFPARRGIDIHILAYPAVYRILVPLVLCPKLQSILRYPVSCNSVVYYLCASCFIMGGDDGPTGLWFYIIYVYTEQRSFYLQRTVHKKTKNISYVSVVNKNATYIKGTVSPD